MLSELGEQSSTALDFVVPVSPLHVTNFSWRHTPGLPLENVSGICVSLIMVMAKYQLYTHYLSSRDKASRLRESWDCTFQEGSYMSSGAGFVNFSVGESFRFALYISIYACVVGLTIYKSYPFI